MDDTSTTAEATHPPGIIMEFVGIEKGDRGRSCEEHDVCGEVVEEDTLLRLRREQILVDGKEETAITCYWVTNWIDHCRVGFEAQHGKTCLALRRGSRAGDKGYQRGPSLL